MVRYNLTGIRNYLNNKHGRKSTQKPFTVSDVQGYLSRGRIPAEYGGEKIVLDEEMFKQTKVKFYTLEND